MFASLGPAGRNSSPTAATIKKGRSAARRISEMTPPSAAEVQSPLGERRREVENAAQRGRGCPVWARRRSASISASLERAGPRFGCMMLEIAPATPESTPAVPSDSSLETASLIRPFFGPFEADAPSAGDAVRSSRDAALQSQPGCSAIAASGAVTRPARPSNPIVNLRSALRDTTRLLRLTEGATAFSLAGQRFLCDWQKGQTVPSEREAAAYSKSLSIGRW